MGPRPFRRPEGTHRFPSAAGGRGFAPLAAQVHRLGLRFGVHLMRGIPRQAVGLELPLADSKYRCNHVANPGSTCAWNTDMCGVNPNHPGAFDWYRAWFSQLAAWGVDFVKVDDIASPTYHAREVALIRRAIDATGRPMVLSLSPGPAQLDQAVHLQAHANQWRVCNDFWDTWPQLRDNLVNLLKWAPYSRPGAWAGDLGGVAQYGRGAVAGVAARLAARRASRLLGARRPARRHTHAHPPPAWRTTRALCLKPGIFR